MNKDQAVDGLLRSSEENGIVITLYGVFGKCVDVSIPFSQAACETGIDELNFSARAGNAMKRNGVFTVGQVIGLIADGSLPQIRNLGKKTENEIKTRVLAFGYERLTETEKKQFFLDVIERNCWIEEGKYGT